MTPPHIHSKSTRHVKKCLLCRCKFLVYCISRVLLRNFSWGSFRPRRRHNVDRLRRSIECVHPKRERERERKIKESPFARMSFIFLVFRGSSLHWGERRTISFVFLFKEEAAVVAA